MRDLLLYSTLTTTVVDRGVLQRFPKESVSNLFLLYWAEVAQDVIKSRANGSTFLEISKSNFRQIDVVRPTATVMMRFDAYVRPWYERIVMNERESEYLITLRDTLLPKLISGELRLNASTSVNPPLMEVSCG